MKRGGYELAKSVFGKDWLCLNKNENLFVNHQWVNDFFVNEELDITKMLAYYPDPFCLKLRESIGNLYGVGGKNIYISNGADGVLADLIAMQRKKYESIHVLDVCFKVYYLLAERFGYDVKIISGDTFKTNVISKTQESGLFVIDSPNSVTGNRLDHGSLQSLIKDDNSFLIWDNVYGDFADEPIFPIKKNLAVVRTFSKYYGLAGLRIGYCIAHEDVVNELLEKKDIYNMNAASQVIALESINRKKYFDIANKDMLINKSFLIRELHKLGFNVGVSMGNFIFIKHELCRAKYMEEELYKCKILVRNFKDAIVSDYLRITIPNAEGVRYLIECLHKILIKT